MEEEEAGAKGEHVDEHVGEHSGEPVGKPVAMVLPKFRNESERHNAVSLKVESSIFDSVFDICDNNNIFLIYSYMEKTRRCDASIRIH